MSGGGQMGAELIAQKAGLRAEAKKARAAAHRAAPQAGELAAQHFLEAIEISPGAILSGYRPIRDELDPTPLMIALVTRGARLCAPVIVGDAPLSFREWRPDSEMVQGAFGAEIPKEGQTLDPQILIMPLLAFDRRGARLGYGGGHYDRTLASLRAKGEALAVGFAYAAQRVEKVPQEPTDQLLDAVVTEEGAVFFPR